MNLSVLVLKARHLSGSAFCTGILCRCASLGIGVASLSLVPRLSLSLPLDFARVNITVCEKLKERESLVWNRAHLWPLSIEFLPNHDREGHGWARFRTRLSLSFNFSCIMFAWAKSKGRERESLGMRLGFP